MSHIVTFYSFKGGVGRSMALANVATQLARWGHRVLIVDWDLEAPGVGHYFQHRRYSDLAGLDEREGIVDLLQAVFAGGDATRQPRWRDFVTDVKLQGAAAPLGIIPAGKVGDEYFKKVRSFDVQDFYLNRGGGYFIETLRNEWKQAYDFILIDSRTGITDVGGICTIQLPDILVLFLSPNQQGLSDTLQIAKRASAARRQLPFDRLKLLTIPIPCRVDVDNEFRQYKRWLACCSKLSTDIYADWLPTTVELVEMLEITKIPYKAYYSFAQRLPVVEESNVDPTSISYAYTTLAALIANKLENAARLRESRDAYIKRAAKMGFGPQEAPVAFLSYAHSDDEHDDGYITKFRQLLSAEVRQQTGKDFLIFQDREDIRWGQLWKERIEYSLDAVTFLIPIITPSFFSSGNCRQELEYFLIREEKLKRKDLILPVYYINHLPLEEEGRHGEDPLVQEIAARQLADWRKLRFKSLKSAQVRHRLESLALNIREALNTSNLK